MGRELVQVGLEADGTTVRVDRGDELAEGTWLQLRSLWGSLGTDANRRLFVPLEKFILSRQAFRAIAKSSRFKLKLDDELKDVLSKTRSDDQALREARTSTQPLTRSEAETALEGGRFTRKLRDFQLDDLGHLLALSHGANFSVPGSGKTTLTYALYEAERLRGNANRLLVIAPLSAFGAWIEEAEDCFNDAPKVHRFEGDPIPLDTEVLLVNYHRLANGYDMVSAWVKGARTQVVLDEAHRMKRGWKGEWGTACLNLAFLAQRRDILTGTPAPHSTRDLGALLDFVWPGKARQILPSDALLSKPPDDAGKQVAEAIEPLFVRTTKDDLALPPVDHNPIIVPLEGLHRDVYMALKDQYAGTFGLDYQARRDFRQMGRVTMYLLEAATNPMLLTAGSEDGADPDIFRHPPLEIPEGSKLATLIEQYNIYETPAKFEELAKLVKANADDGRKTLIWSNFVRNLKLLKGQLSAYEPALIYGAVPAFAPEGETSRATEIERFRHDPDCLILLANPAAMSEGISLHHDCHEAIYLDRTFNAGQYLQSIDRIHRLGLDPGERTRITFLLTADTIDLTVDDRVGIKARNLGDMLSDPGLPLVALPDEESYGPPIDSDEDLEALFRHLRGE